MSDFDFLKEFGKNLDKEQPYNFAEADWNDMDNRLNAQALAEKKRNYWKTWALPLAVSLGFLTMGYALWENMLQSAKMQSEIQQLKVNLEAKNSTISQRDTLVQRVNIVRYDTVYRTIVLTREIREKKQSSTLFLNQNQFESNKEINQNLAFNSIEIAPKTTGNISLKIGEISENVQSLNDLKEVDNSILTTKKIDLVQNNEKKEVLIPKKEVLISSNNANEIFILSERKVARKSTQLFNISALKTPIKPIKSITNQELPVGNILLKPMPMIAYKTGIIRKFHPHNFTLGIHQGGVVFDKENQDTHASYTKGASLEMALTKRLHLIGSIDFVKIDFEVRANDLNQFQIPVVQPPAPNYAFNQVQVKQPILDYSLGLRYDIFKRKKMCPYFSLAYIGEQTFERSLMYDFIHFTNGDKETIRKRSSAHDDFTSGVKVAVGVDWFVFKRWSLGFNGYVQKQFSNQNSFLGERVGINVGVKYHFKQ
jgi:hypothetical protein